MEGVLSRLEAVTTRLESYERGLQNSTRAATPAASANAVPKATPPPPAAKPTPPVIISVDPPKTITMEDWDSLISKEVGALSAAGAKLPEQFQSSTKLFASAAQLMVDVVKQSRSCRKPTMAELQAMVSPMGTAMQDIEALIRGPRTPATNHHRALSECVQSFAWVTLDISSGAPPPGAMLAESQAGADMFINKVIMEYRQTAPEHKEWATALKAFMARLGVLAKAQFPQGLSWVGSNTPGAAPTSAAPPTGTPAAEPAAASSAASTGIAAQNCEAVETAIASNEVDESTEEASTAAPDTAGANSEAAPSAAGPVAEASEPTATEPAAAKPAAEGAGASKEPLSKGPPPPPPPPPAGMLLEKLSAAAGAAGGGAAAVDSRGELMAALNKGSGVTSGLKKVTDDMKTKNQTNRSGVVKAAPAAPKKDAAAAKGPTRKELKQNRWLIENWVACEEPVVLEEGDVQRSHAVYISNCKQCVVQVKGKVNTIMLDGCSKVGLVFSSVLATVEAVNCQSCQIQCEQSCPTLSIDKTDGAKVFLSAQAAESTEVVTSKCSALTVNVLPLDAQDDPVEHPVPEQFVSKVVDGKLVTTPVIHM